MSQQPTSYTSFTGYDASDKKIARAFRIDDGSWLCQRDGESKPAAHQDEVMDIMDAWGAVRTVGESNPATIGEQTKKDMEEAASLRQAYNDALKEIGPGEGTPVHLLKRANELEVRHKSAPSSPVAWREQEQADNRWTKMPPTEQGTYWHWNGDEDCCPLPTFVMYSGFTCKCFVTMGQLGLTHAIDCDQYGGWWKKLPDPPLPSGDGREQDHLIDVTEMIGLTVAEQKAIDELTRLENGLGCSIRWSVEQEAGGGWSVLDSTSTVFTVENWHGEDGQPVAEFSAAARNYTPTLLALISRLSAANKALEGDREMLSQGIRGRDRIIGVTADESAGWQEQLATVKAENDALWSTCRIIYYPTTGEYPVEHSMAARKENREAICAALSAASPATDNSKQENV